MKKSILTLLIVTFFSQLISSQNLKRANFLFDNKAYINAAELYLNENTNSKEIQQKLGDCYYYNGKMKEAVVWYTKLISNYENNINPIYYFRASHALKGINQYHEADKLYNKYNELIKSSSANVNTLAFFENLNTTNKEPFLIHKMDINTPNSEFGVSFYGDKVIFSSTNTSGKIYNWNKQPYLDLMLAEIDSEGNFSNITPFSSNINSKKHEANAVFTKDGKFMYFTGNGSKNSKRVKNSKKVNHLKIFKAEFIDGKWTNITELPFNGDNYSVEHPALSPNEKQLYFSSDMPGTIGSFDLFVVSINNDGTYSSPKNLGSTINTIHREQFPFLSSKNVLYFSSDGHLGLGGLDIFKSELIQNNFSTPVNLSGKINSNRDDFSFIINEEENTGYFSSNRIGGAGDDDIYRFTQLKKYYVNGFVKDKKTLALLPNSLVKLTDKNDKVLNEITVNNNANYSFEIQPNATYKLKGSKKLYNTREIEFSTDTKGNISQNIMLLLELYEDLEKKIIVENGKTQIKINPIYFDFDKWNIRSDAALELDNVVTIMKKYSDMIIEIGAHTDCRGSNEYNLRLSHKRAKSVLEYLISQGVNPQNVKSKGYGETSPVNNCIKPGMCDEKGYSINRRCEFIIKN